MPMPRPLLGAADEIEPLVGTTDEVEPLLGAADEIEPLLGAADEIEPLVGTIDEVEPLVGTADEIEPLLGTIDADGDREVEPLLGTRGASVEEGLLSELGDVDGEVVRVPKYVHLESTRSPLSVGDTQASRACVAVEYSPVQSIVS